MLPIKTVCIFAGCTKLVVEKRAYVPELGCAHRRHYGKECNNDSTGSRLHRKSLPQDIAMFLVDPKSKLLAD